MTGNTAPAAEDIPFLDIDADIIGAFNRKSDKYPCSKGQPDYEQVSKLIREAAYDAETRGDRVTLHPETVRLIAERLTVEGRKRPRGPQVDRAEKLFRLGVLGHKRLEELKAEQPKQQMDVLEERVAGELGTNVSDLKIGLAGYRRLLDEKGSIA